MKRLLIILMMASLAIPAFASGSVSSAQSLAKRILGGKSADVVFREMPEDGSETFCVSGENGKIIISGTTVPAMTMGLNWYLRHICGTEVSWNHFDKVVLPSKLPVPEQEFRSSARVEKRFFLNYCTFGYTLPWWGWKEWERLIDWMALNGINHPLAITGQESVWLKVWTDMGMSDQEVRSYFTGPAHLPWHRMQNIDKWQGPLPESWIENQEELQKKITARERELGMKPVLPAFSGHVPYELKLLHPDSDIRSLGQWAGFPDEYHCWFLDPMDPLYTEIQKRFLAEQERLYGTDHIYGIDLFNEVTPPSWEPEYLARVGRQVYESLHAADKDAVWLQMTWMFYYDRKDWTNERIEPYITSYPSDKSILLDYYCDYQEVWKMTSSFYGVPFIWCYLGNFGGNSMLRGDFSQVNERIENAFRNAGNNLVGLGSTLEGFDCNPFIYEFVFEKAWDYSQNITVDEYASHLAVLRSGGSIESVQAWTILLSKVLTASGHRSAFSRRPGPEMLKSSVEERNGYSNDDLGKALELLLAGSPSGPSARFDLVNFTRQWLVNIFDQFVFEYQDAIKTRDIDSMSRMRKVMEEIMSDIDRLLACEPSFLLGKWISYARKLGHNNSEKACYESNARNILTTWGDRASSLNDYASREWSGLAGEYYKTRWEMFFDEAEACVKEGREFDNKGYTEKICDYEKKWWEERIGSFCPKAKGNALSESRRIFAKYSVIRP